MQENHPTLSALIKLHADLGGQIFENRKCAEKLAEDMKHVEAVIRMFSPSFDVRKISMKRRYKSNPWFKRGTLFRHAIDVLRVAETPLTAREIAEAMIVAAGATPEPKAIRDLIGGVNASLQNNAGKVVEKAGEGMPARWKLIDGG
jgi:hypothetical protein